MLELLHELDHTILIWIQSVFVHEALTPVITFITHLGNVGMIWIILSAVLCLNKKTRRTGLLAFMALFITFLIDNVLLKNLVARIRPYDATSLVRLLIEKQDDFSFPSGHTGSAFAVAGVIARRMPKKYGVPCILFAALQGFTRLYAGVHYPSDVIVGAVNGSMIAAAVVHTERMLLLRRCKHKSGQGE